MTGMTGMTGLRLLVVVWWSASIAAAAFRARGPLVYTTFILPFDPPASSSSAAVPSATIPSATLQPPYPIPSANTTAKESGFPLPSGTGQGLQIGSSTANTTVNSLNTTRDASCTVNIRNANIEWWYPATYESTIGTLATKAQNFSQIGYYTLVPNTNTFDASYTISNELALTQTSIWDTDFDMYWTLFDVYPVTPTAASTHIITRTEGAVPLPTGNIIPTRDFEKYTVNYDALGPASLPIATVANKTSAVSSATPFVYLTAYEVESAVNGTTATKTVTLDQPSAFEYPLKTVENSPSATGAVPDDFLPTIPESDCAPGTIYGTVTVLIVVNLSYLRVLGGFPFLVHIESSVLGFGSDEPVNIAETSQGVPFTVSWDFPSTGTAKVKTTTTQDAGNRPSAIQMTRGGDSVKFNHGNPQPTSETVGSIGTTPVVVAPSSVVVIGSQTLQPGGSAITVGGSTVVSLVPSATAIVVGGTTSAIPIVAIPGSPTQTVGTLLGAPIVVGSSSTVVIADQTLTPGGPAVTIGGNAVSLAPSASALIIGGKTSALPQVIFPTAGSGQFAQSAQAPPILTIGTSTFTANAATQFFIAPGQTLTPGGTATVGGTVVSLAPSANFIVVGGTTQPVADAPTHQATAKPEIIIGGSTITALVNNLPSNVLNAGSDNKNTNPGPTFVVSGETLIPGHAITVDGTTISLPVAGSAVVVNGVTSTFVQAAAQITPPPLTIGSQVFTAQTGSGTTYRVGSEVLTPGGQITVSGSTISLAPGATALVINGVTTTLSPQAAITSAPLLTIGSQVFTAQSGSSGPTYTISGQTLTPGGVLTISDSTISLAPDATALIINGVTTTLSSPQAAITNPPLLTIGSNTYTAVSGTGTTFVIGGQTLTPGGTITVDGTTIVLSPGATQLVFGSGGSSTTEMLFPATTTAGRGSITSSPSASSSASAGATGQGGGAAPTSSKKGAAVCLRSGGGDVRMLLAVILSVAVVR